MLNALTLKVRPEHLCTIGAAVSLAASAGFPALAACSAVSAFVVFCVCLSHYKSAYLTNLPFLFVGVTLSIILSYSTLWSALLGMVNLDSGEINDSRNWAIQYIAMAITSMILGASLVRWRSHDTAKRWSAWHGRLQCPWIYLTAAFVPLLLNLFLYYWSLRGSDYVDLYKAALGPQKYIMFLIFLTHGAFIRLFDGWNQLQATHKIGVVACVLLFLSIYVFLIPMRTYLFIFAMYVIYFFTRQINWRVKVAILASIIALFSWMAANRSGTDDDIRTMGIAKGTASAMSFGIEMVDMVPWAYDEVRSQGPTWGLTSLSELVTTKYSPGNRYAQDKAPLYFESGGGFGFFYIAELLLNFGYWGGLLSVGVLGMMLQRISMTQRTIVLSTVLPALLGCSFPLMRNDMMSTLKAPLYIIISCLILDSVARIGFDTGKLLQLATISETAMR
jgi:O-antigen polysaccharide polymerase Wzy